MNRFRYAACLVAFLLAGCAPQTEIVKLYHDTDEGAAHRQFDRFLVVAVAGDRNSRQRLEDLIVFKLRDADARAIPAYTLPGLEESLQQADIDRSARDSDAEGILVTHIVSVDTEASVDTGRTSVTAECRGGDPADYFLYDYDELKEPDTVRLAHTVVAVTNLYAAEDGRRIWTIQSTCFEKASMDEVLEEEADAIARQLRTDDLIG